MKNYRTCPCEHCETRRGCEKQYRTSFPEDIHNNFKDNGFVKGQRQVDRKFYPCWIKKVEREFKAVHGISIYEAKDIVASDHAI
jgi:hypothetical protein